MKPYHKTKLGVLYQGGCLEVMKGLPEQSVNCCVTSPPYWGLRDYGTDPQIWEDINKPFPDDPGRHFSYCEHEWGCTEKGGLLHENRNFKTGANADVEGPLVKVGEERRNQGGNFCQLCGAWKGSLGLEPTPELFISNMVQIFREVKRVLKDDGTLWLNIGDSYTSGGRTHRRDPDSKNIPALQEFDRVKTPKGLKPKDLVGIPWMLAFALRADGWYLRQDIIWHKPNPMPESVKDRCTKAHEYIFLLSKSQKYFYDYEAIKEPVAASTIGRGPVNFGGAKGRRYKTNIKETDPNYRNGNEQWGRTFDCRKSCKNGRNKRSVWTVTTKPYKEAHFATFPEDLIRPCILAGCPEGGTVIDPFFGAGTTGVACEKLNRKWIGIDLNEEYCEIAKARVDGVGMVQMGMF